MTCSGPFRGAQGHSSLQTCTERRGHMDWKRGEVASCGFPHQSLQTAVLLHSRNTLLCSSIALGIKFLLGAGGWGGLGALGTTGLVLPATAQSPARLVYGSAALVASLRGQQSHFATLPITRLQWCILPGCNCILLSVAVKGCSCKSGGGMCDLAHQQFHAL